MRLHRFPALLAAVLGLLTFVPANPAAARDLKYPTKSPAFVFQLPDGWKTEAKGGGSDAFYCVPNDGSNLNVQFYTVENTELGDDNEAFAKLALKAGGVSDIEVVKSDSRSLKNGQEVKFVRSTFKSPTKVSFVSLMVFLPINSTQKCVIHSFLPASQLDDHKAQIETILDSIQSLE